MVNELKDKTNNIFNNSLSTYLDDEILQRLSDASNSSFVTNITLCDLDEEYLTLLNLTGIIDIFNLYKQISNQKEYEIENDLLKLLIKPA